MSSAELCEGKQRVREHLIEPLERLGLRRPSGMTVSQYKVMVEELCGRLSYMTALNLDALVVQVSTLPGGRDGSRFPIAAKILGWAADIQPPADTASPLMLAVFSGPLGRQSMEEDWAPELLSHLRKHRLWPRGMDLTRIKDRAGEARRRVALVSDRQRRGLSTNEEDLRLVKQRTKAAQKCERIMEQIEAQR